MSPTPSTTKTQRITQRLTHELTCAHQIILNALALMTSEQKCEWARLNQRDDVIGEGTTRYHERADVLEHAREALREEVSA